MECLKTHFDKALEQHIRGKTGEYSYYADYYEKIIDFKSFPPGSTVFDLGAGDCKITEELSLRYPNLEFIGVDFSDSLLSGKKKIKTINMDLRVPDSNLLKKNSSNNVIALSFSVIQYLSENEYYRLMKAIFPICKEVFHMSIPDDRKIMRYYRDSKTFLWRLKAIYSKISGKYGIDGSKWHSAKRLSKLSKNAGYNVSVNISDENKFRFDIYCVRQGMRGKG